MNGDARTARDRALRRLSGLTLAALGGGAALTGFFAVEAKHFFSGQSSAVPTDEPVVTAPTTTEPHEHDDDDVPRTTTNPNVAPTRPTTTTNPGGAPIQPPTQPLRRGGGRSSARSGGS